MKLEDFTPLFTLQSVRNIYWDAFEIECSLGLQATSVAIEALRPIEFRDIDEIRRISLVILRILADRGRFLNHE